MAGVLAPAGAGDREAGLDGAVAEVQAGALDHLPAVGAVLAADPGQARLPSRPGNLPGDPHQQAYSPPTACDTLQAMVRIQNANGEPVASVDDWFRRAPPKKGLRQWKDGRSAKELAKAWFRRGGPAFPKELTELFATHPATRGLEIDLAIPEAITRLDDFPGEHRNHDLILRGHVGERPVVIGVEAKADEPFGKETVGEYLQRTRGTCSRAPERITELCQALFGWEPAAVADVRYQLLTALAGTLVEANSQHAELAILVVHEFVTPVTDDERHAANATDLDRFVAALGGGQLTPGKLVGPFSVPGGRFVPSEIPALVGKACVLLR